MTYINTQRMRKAAVFVTSLDEESSRRLIANLPPAEAEALRHAIEELGLVDIEETRDVLHEFRLSRAVSAEDLGGVEVDWSSAAEETQPAMYDAPSGRQFSANNDRTAAPAAVPFGFLREADKQAVAKLLLRENPQTVAVVMSQLAADLAADLLSALPGSLQADVLERLAEIHPADEQTLQVVESHLAAWIEDHRQREKRLSQGNELVRQILAQTPDQQREEMLRQLKRRNQSLAQRYMASPDSASPVDHGQPRAMPPTKSECRSQQAVELISAMAQVRGVDTAHDTAPPSLPMAPASGDIQYADDAAPLAGHDIPTARNIADTDNRPLATSRFDLADLNAMSDRTLLDTLRQVDSQIALLALAGADSQLLNRVLSQLPRRQAKQFRRQILTTKPTRLSDMLAARHEFAQLAHQVDSQRQPISA